MAQKKVIVPLSMDKVEGLAAAILQADPEGNGELSKETLVSVAGRGIYKRTIQ